MEKGYGILRICRLLEVSRSSFYSFLKDRKKTRLSRDEKLEKKIEMIFRKNKGRYGSPRIYRELKRSGEESAGKNKVAKIMSLKNLKARQKASYVPRMTRSDASSKTSPRLFRIGESSVEAENKVWFSDITYIPFKERYLYLVVFLDLYNRELKSWSLNESLDAVHVQKTLRDGMKSVPGNLQGLLIHTDRGVQYSSKIFQEEIDFFSLTQSMSRKGNCYDNAFVESFFHTLKTELDWKHCETKEELEKEIAIYMDWYNTERMHSSLEYLSPKEFKQRRLFKA